ncbi:MAG: hypothetical protein ACI85U_001624, partial [Candidatus Promineifilaceae bacterium]
QVSRQDRAKTTMAQSQCLPERQMKSRFPYEDLRKNIFFHLKNFRGNKAPLSNEALKQKDVGLIQTKSNTKS